MNGQAPATTGPAGHDVARALVEQTAPVARLRQTGAERYLVHVPFHYDDGDHPRIVLEKHAGAWRLSDEAHTALRLELHAANEPGAVEEWPALSDAITRRHGVRDDAGILTRPVDAAQAGRALWDFVQTMLTLSATAHALTYRRDA